jgi:hypothetical protein
MGNACWFIVIKYVRKRFPGWHSTPVQRPKNKANWRKMIFILFSGFYPAVKDAPGLHILATIEPPGKGMTQRGDMFFFLNNGHWNPLTPQ